MTHYQVQKVKGQGHKVMRCSSTRTSNISHKRHSVVKIYICLIGNRGRRSEWQGPIFDRKLLNRRVCACAVSMNVCMPKTRLSYCQMAKILAPLYAIAVAEHDGDGSI